MTIDWESNTWNDDNNIKNYIKKNGNADVNLSKFSHDDLMQLAKNTEKALALDEGDDIPCHLCENLFEGCNCYRCPECYSTLCDCVRRDEIKFIVNKTFYFVDYSEKEETDMKINILKYKLKIKMFLLSIKNNQFILRNVNDLIKLIINERFNITKNKDDIDLFTSLNKQSRLKQVTVLKYIIDTIFDGG